MARPLSDPGLGFPGRPRGAVLWRAAGGSLERTHVLRGFDGVRPGAGKDGGEVDGGAVAVVARLEQGCAAGFDRASQRRSVGDAAEAAARRRGFERAAEVAPGDAVERFPADGAAAGLEQCRRLSVASALKPNGFGFGGRRHEGALVGIPAQSCGEGRGAEARPAGRRCRSSGPRRSSDRPTTSAAPRTRNWDERPSRVDLADHHLVERRQRGLSAEEATGSRATARRRRQATRSPRGPPR